MIVLVNRIIPFLFLLEHLSFLLKENINLMSKWKSDIHCCLKTVKLFFIYSFCIFESTLDHAEFILLFYLMEQRQLDLSEQENADSTVMAHFHNVCAKAKVTQQCASLQRHYEIRCCNHQYICGSHEITCLDGCCATGPRHDLKIDRCLRWLSMVMLHNFQRQRIVIV